MQRSKIKCRSMKCFARFSTIAILVAMLSGCSSGMPKLFWDVDEGKDTAPGASASSASPSRPPLVVPPELRDAEVPEPDQVATGGEPRLTADEKKLVAGTAVALDAKIYSNGAGDVFSAVIDGMTSLNLPVASVDSPSGTITTDWIREQKGSTPVVFVGMFGSGDPLATRYRFVVRILRQQTAEGVQMTRLEIRTIGQAYIDRQWHNKPIQRKVADELFSATEERLTKPQAQPAGQ